MLCSLARLSSRRCGRRAARSFSVSDPFTWRTRGTALTMICSDKGQGAQRDRARRGGCDVGGLERACQGQALSCRTSTPHCVACCRYPASTCLTWTVDMRTVTRISGTLYNDQHWIFTSHELEGPDALSSSFADRTAKPECANRTECKVCNLGQKINLNSMVL